MPEAAALPDLAGRLPLLPERRSAGAHVADLAARGTTIRQERLSGIHNPWGLAGAITDPWAFLDLCESAPVVAAAQSLLGPDILLWDSELYLDGAHYCSFLREDREGRYWPATPLAGAVILVAFEDRETAIEAIDVAAIGRGTVPQLAARGAGRPLYVIRVMPATSHYDRDPRSPANRCCMEEQVLINYTNRPLWLLAGENRGGSDLVRGFSMTVPVWIEAVAPAA